MAEIRRLDEASQTPESFTGITGVPPAERTLPGMPEGENLPPRLSDTPLTRAAQSAGTAVGSAVNRVRSGLTLIKGSATGEPTTAESLSSTAQQLPEKMAHGVENLKESARQGSERLQETVQEQAARLGRDVRRQLQTLNAQSKRIQREYPIEVILGCAAAAFVLGFTLRIWRSGRG